MKKKTLIIIMSLASLSAFVASCSNSNGGGQTINGDYYSLTFNFNDGNSRPYKKDVEKGSALESIPSPRREGYQFDGWYSAEEGGDKLVFPYTASEDATFYAHWKAAEFNVVFDLNYESSVPFETVSVKYNQEVSAPSGIPTREGFVFRYWTSDPEGLEQVSFPAAIKKDTTYYASWRADDIKVYNVTISYGDYVGAPEEKVIEVEDGGSVTRTDIGNVSRPGFDFKGWALSEGGEVIKLPYTPTSDQTLYAVWEEKEFTLSFRYNYVDSPNKDVYSDSVVKYSDEVNAPETNPTRKDYVFDGWYSSDVGGTKIQFPAHLNKNSTFYAHWIHNAVVTDTFHAEYCVFDPAHEYWGYSGNTNGSSCIILADDNLGVGIDDYPTNSTLSAGHGFVVSYQYSRDAILTFEIEATEEIKGATLKVNWGSEFEKTYDSEGENAYVVSVNDESIKYEPVTLRPGGFAAAGDFVLSTIGNINLKKGLNYIRLYADNDNPEGGTMKSAAPVIDYVKIEGASGKLSWHPVYDNLNGKA